MINNRQNGRRRGRGGQQARNGQPGSPDRGNRIDNRARGNAAQLLEKYKTLARDAQMQGDRVNTEYYLQFADHYFRVLSESRARFEEQRPRRDDERDDEFEMGDEESFGAPTPGMRSSGNGNGVSTHGTAESWDGDDGRDTGEAEREPAPQAAEPRRDDRPRADGERRPRRSRERAARPVANDLVDMADEGVSRIEADRLPGALSPPVVQAEAPDAAAAPAVEDGGGEDAPRPRRRAPRRPRAESSVVEA